MKNELKNGGRKIDLKSKVFFLKKIVIVFAAVFLATYFDLFENCSDLFCVKFAPKIVEIRVSWVSLKSFSDNVEKNDEKVRPTLRFLKSLIGVGVPAV